MKYLIIIFILLLTNCAYNHIHLKAYHKGSETSIGIAVGEEGRKIPREYGLKWAANHTTQAIEKVLCEDKLEIPGDEYFYIISELERRKEIVICEDTRKIYPNY